MYTCFTRMYSCFTRMLLVCISYVLVCCLYVPVCTRMLLVCTRGVLVTIIFSCISVANNINLPDVSVVSPINVDKLALQLCNHPDRNKVQYVLNGFRYGFRLGFNPDAATLKSAKANCPSAFEHPSIVDNYLAKEVSLGRVFLGP